MSAWKAEQTGHVLYLHATAGEGVALVDLGPKADACNEPVQISSEYASVEGFWQGLKFEKESDRRRVAALSGGRARMAGEEAWFGPTVSYESVTIPVGTWGHWALMQRACEAKFTQNDEAREALVGTGKRPLTHRMRRDSRSIPGVVMAEIWMRIRASLGAAVEVDDEGE